VILPSFIKNIINDLKRSLSSNYNLARYKKRYPNCDFYPGAIISDTEFQGYNVVFNDTIIDGCKLGAHTYVQKKATIFNAEIGKFCSIAAYVSIGPGIHKTDGISTHPVFYLQNTPLVKKYSDKDLFTSSKKTLIGNDVWIGERAIIVDGVSIGNGSIVAAGAVVTKDVLPYSIVGGVPAKILKMRFDENIASSVNASAWWDKSEEWLEKNYRTFADPEQFLDHINKP
jgi:acetyltransferase-like isoleucine patch superfamily enzyme